MLTESQPILNTFTVAAVQFQFHTHEEHAVYVRDGVRDILTWKMAYRNLTRIRPEITTVFAWSDDRKFCVPLVKPHGAIGRWSRLYLRIHRTRFSKEKL